MEKFRYLSSADHAAWYVPLEHQGEVYLESTILNEFMNKRYQIREWIETNCQGWVLAWNNTSTPHNGQDKWGTLLAPQGHISLFFELETDRILFQLTWSQ
jgi:hypothetical protein